MKSKIIPIILLLFFGVNAFAQQNSLNSVSATYDYVMTVESAKIDVVNNKVMVSLQIIANQDIPARQSVILIPEIQDTVSSYMATLPPIYINSRNQQIYYQREKSKFDKDAMAVRKYNKKDLPISYERSVPYEKWMETAVLKLRKQSCGCNVTKDRGEENLCCVREPKPAVELCPVFRVPVPEPVKTRYRSGSAYLTFKVNKWDILPEYMKNAIELQKIYSTIDTVKNDPDVTVKRMTIDGYASPEGPLKNNQMLSVNRTNALRDYLYQLGLLPNVSIVASGKGENWDGFMKALKSNTTFPQYSTILSIANQYIGLDEKEAQMKKLAPEGFAYCLNNIFPKLRCTNYNVEYVVRPFTLEESEKVFNEQPTKLSANEIYRLAEKYKDNPERYNAIMQKASLFLPDDPYINLTMAYLAIKRNAPDEAQTYLNKVPAWPEKQLNQAIVTYLKGGMTDAELIKIQDEYKQNQK